MFLQIHPTRSEALTASETTLTRWSLATNPATILTQVSTAPRTLFNFVYDAGARLQTFGGVTRTPDGEFFALQQPQTRGSYHGPCLIEWRSWNDLLPSRTIVVPQTEHDDFQSLDSSPNGRWLVIGAGAQIFLLDWHTGEVISRHFCGGPGCWASGLVFDPTSTFVAELSSGDRADLSPVDDGVALKLWRLDPVEHFVPRPAREEWPSSHKFLPQDYVSGSMALTLIHENLDRTNIAWPDEDLMNTTCSTVFSPDSRIVVFSLNASNSKCGVELVAYEVISGRRLWCARSEEESSGPCIFTPDGRHLLVPVQGNELLVYSAQDGALLHRQQAGCDEPVQALAFDHNGTTLWLAGEKTLLQYQTQS